jgi:hypothetical protein
MRADAPPHTDGSGEAGFAMDREQVTPISKAPAAAELDQGALYAAGFNRLVSAGHALIDGCQAVSAEMLAFWQSRLKEDLATASVCSSAPPRKARSRSSWSMRRRRFRPTPTSRPGSALWRRDRWPGCVSRRGRRLRRRPLWRPEGAVPPGSAGGSPESQGTPVPSLQCSFEAERSPGPRRSVLASRAPCCWRAAEMRAPGPIGLSIVSRNPYHPCRAPGEDERSRG